MPYRGPTPRKFFLRFYSCKLADMNHAGRRLFCSPTKVLGYVLTIPLSRFTPDFLTKMADCASAGIPTQNFLFRRGSCPPILGGCKFLFIFRIRGAQRVCREPSESRVFSAFDLLSCFLLQDKAVEPYLQRHPYAFEVQERVMPGLTMARPLLLTAIG